MTKNKKAKINGKKNVTDVMIQSDIFLFIVSRSHLSTLCSAACYTRTSSREKFRTQRTSTTYE